MKTPPWPSFTGPLNIDLKLDRVKEFLKEINNPEKKLKNIIHVAGTNGKGSTIAYLRTMLESSGFSVNCYTSPHLINFNERIRIKGKLISDEYILELSEKLKNIKTSNKVTFFEGTTIMAILAFKENPADFNIFEVGLGGRLDATNIFQEKLANIITTIDIDHTEFLGNTIEKIAAEKCGIITENTKLFVGSQTEKALKTIKNKAKNLNSFFYNEDFKIIEDKFQNNKAELKLPKNLLSGQHQKDNFATALQTFLEITNYKYQNINLERLNWPGRMQYLEHENKHYWLDGGHNENAAIAIKNWLKTNQIDHIIIGLKKDKEISNFLKHFKNIKAPIHFTEIKSFKDCYKIKDLNNISELKDIFSSFNNSFNDIIKTITPNSKILICGSLFLVGEILENFKYKIS